MENVNKILGHTNLILDKFQKIDQETGEKYNVFDVLKVHANELNHSAIISNLLNSKGSQVH